MAGLVNPIARLSETQKAKLHEHVRRIQASFLAHVRETRGARLTADAAAQAKIAGSEVFLGGEAKSLG